MLKGNMATKSDILSHIIDRQNLKGRNDMLREKLKNNDVSQ